MDNPMAILLQAAVGSPTATPFTAAADEFAEYLVPASRLSIQPPPNIQTPNSPPADASNSTLMSALLSTVSPLPMQAGAATPVRRSPAPLSDDSVAALATAAAAAEAADLRAIIKDLEHAAVVAAQAAENAQLRRDMAHMHAMHAQRMQSDADLRQALRSRACHVFRI